MLKHKYGNILLNIPNSTDKEGLTGWSNQDMMTEVINNETDWGIDSIFNDVLCKSEVFPYSKFYVNADGRDETNDIILTTYKGYARGVTSKDIDGLNNIFIDYANGLYSKLYENGLLINCHSFMVDESIDAPDIILCNNTVGDDEEHSHMAPSDVIDFLSNRIRSHKYSFSVVSEDTSFGEFVPKCLLLPYDDPKKKYYAITIYLNKKIFMGKGVFQPRRDAALRLKSTFHSAYADIINYKVDIPE